MLRCLHGAPRVSCWSAGSKLEKEDQVVVFDSAADSRSSGRFTKKSKPVQASTWSTLTV